MDIKTAIGELWINSKKTNIKLHPTANSSQFYFNSHYGAYEPNICINISEEKFNEVISRLDKSEVKVELLGDNLGVINDKSGYDAANDGSYSREIIYCYFSVTRNKASTTFKFTGKTNYVNPKTVASKLNTLKTYRLGRYDFIIVFEIPDSDIGLYFKSPKYLDIMSKYINQCEY